MAATASDIRRWLAEMYEKDTITHMIVVCDTFDWEDYPVYVTKSQDVHEVETHHAQSSMQKVMEVYSANHDLEEQMAEHRAFNYD